MHLFLRGDTLATVFMTSPVLLPRTKGATAKFVFPTCAMHNTYRRCRRGSSLVQRRVVGQVAGGVRGKVIGRVHPQP